MTKKSATPGIHFKRQIYQIFFIVIVVVSVFANSLGNGFVWDDTALFIGKKVYAEFDLAGMFLGLSNGLEYLPLRDLSYAVDHLLWGANPAGFHATNLLLHVANACLVYFCALWLCPMVAGRDTFNVSSAATSGPLVAALVFAVHPIQSQAVNFVTCRNVLLSGFFFLLSLFCYLRFIQPDEKRRAWFYGASLLCFICALLSKATAITLSLVLILVVFFAFRKVQLLMLASAVPFLALSIGFSFLFKSIAIQTKMIDERIVAFTGSGISGKIADATQIIFFYLGKVILPNNLSAEYDTVLSSSMASFAFLSAFGVLTAILGYSIALRKRFPMALFALVFMIATLLPVLHFFPTNPLVADRYFYLSFVPLSLLFATIVERFAVPQHSKRVYFFAIFVLIAWSGQTFACNRMWKSEEELWTANIGTAPNQAKGYINLAIAHIDSNHFDKALAVIEAGRKFCWLDPYAAYFRGVTLEKKHDYAAAVVAYKEALKLDSTMMEALFHLAGAYEQLGQWGEAALCYNQLLASREQDVPGFKPRAEANLKTVAIRLEPIVSPLREVVFARPRELQPRVELALALERFGFYKEALTQYQAAESLGASRWELFYNMANIMKRLGKFNEASKFYQKSILLNPDNVDAYNNLGLVFREMKEYKYAIDAFQKGVDRDNRFSFAQFNLATTYFRMGDKENALRIFRRVQLEFPDLDRQVMQYLKALKVA